MAEEGKDNPAQQQQQQQQQQAEEQQQGMPLQTLLTELIEMQDQGDVHAFVTDNIGPLFDRTPMTKQQRRQWVWEVIGRIITMTRTADAEHREAQIGGFHLACAQMSHDKDPGGEVDAHADLQMWLNVSEDFTLCMNRRLSLHLTQGPPEM